MSIRIKALVIVFSLIFFTGICTIIVSRIISTNVVKKEIADNLLTTAKSRARHIETFLSLRKESIKQLSESIVLKKLLSTQKTNEAYTQYFDYVKDRLINTAKISEYVYDIFVLNKNGLIVTSSEESDIGKDKSSNPYFLGGKQGFYIKDAYVSSENINTLAFSAPLFVKGNSNLLGVVVMRVPMRKLDKITMERTGLWKTGEVYLVNKDGYMITPSGFIKDAFLRQSLDMSGFEEKKDLSEEEKTGNEETGIYRNYIGNIVIGTHHNIKGTGWRLFAEIPKEEALASVAELTRIQLILLFVISCVGIILSILISRNISKPILRLNNGIEEVLKGNLDYKVGTTAKDEIGQLSRAFDNMAAKLKKDREALEEYSVHLEGIVKERTMELRGRFKMSEQQRIATQNILQDLDEANKYLKAEIAENKRADEERKKLEAQLHQAQKIEAVGTLAGGIAHDFNNILSAIIGYTEVSLVKVEKGTSLHENLQEVLKAGIRARDLVQQILTFSRQSEHEQGPVHVSLMVKEALKLLRATLPTTIEIQQDIQSNSAVLGNPTQLHQILMNLCTNAGYSMKEKGGILEVTLTNVELDSAFTSQHDEMMPGPYIKLSVRDTGYGMSPDILERMFDPFFTTKEKGEGTGMGLSVVHGIVKDCGGAFTVYSKPGSGSTFNVFLPVFEGEAKLETKTEEPLPHGNERILFIDDELAIVDIGRQMLERLGYEVVTRTSSIEALELFRAKPDRFDLVITDMTMPKMTGEEMAREIMLIRPDIPVILCTGFSATMTADKAKAMGVKAFLMKPIVMSVTAGTVRQVLDQ